MGVNIYLTSDHILINGSKAVIMVSIAPNGYSRFWLVKPDEIFIQIIYQSADNCIYPAIICGSNT